jgi:glutamine synthetase
MHCFVFCLKVIEEAPLFGFEQEYTMLSKGTGFVLGWPEGGYPAPQVRHDVQH